MIQGNKIPFVKENLVMKKALAILNKKKLGVVLVRNKNNRTVGIITDGQIRRYNQKKIDLLSMKAKDVMTKKPIGINQDALAAKALALMNSKKITSLIVYNKKNKMKTDGIVHIHHILQSNIT